MTEDELEATLFRHMPPEFFQRLLRAVFGAHKVAAEECAANFEFPEAENVVGFYRRAKLEGLMRATADRTHGIRHQVVRSPKSAWNHTELRSGPAVLTASSVQSPCDLVEEAEFRNTLARGNQGVLWPEPGDTPDPEAPLYVLLLHSKSRWRGRDRARYGYLPGSAYIAFPLPDLSGYAHEINLFERFPGVVDSLIPQEWDQEAKVSYLVSARKTVAV